VEPPVRQILFFSTAAQGQSDAEIADIVAASYGPNMRDGITGLLVAGGHRYLQIVEGAEQQLDAMMVRVRRDRRHVGVTVLVDRMLARRSFSSWSVAFHGEPVFGDFFTLEQMLGIMRTRVADRSVRAQVDSFLRMLVLRPPSPPPSPWTMAAPYRAGLPLDGGH
jgi:hypothetical protein